MAIELDNFSIILYPLITEKAVNMIEEENKIVFVVNKQATKTAIKTAIEKLYSVKVEKINVINDRKGKKRAIVRLDKKHKANDLAIKLGVL